MIARGLLAAVLFAGFLAAAGTRIASSQEPDAEGLARAYLAQSRIVPLPENAGLAPAQQRSSAVPSSAPADRALGHVATLESPGATHVRFQETEDGIPIFGANVVVNLTKGSDEVGFVIDNRTEATVASSSLRVDEDEAADIAINAAGIAELRDTPDATLVYYPIDDELYLAWQILLPALDPLGDWLVMVLAEDGDVALVTNVMPLDTGRVFDPNPVATGGPQSVQHCDTTAAEGVVDDEYVTRTLLGINSGQNQLRGQYVDLTAPGILGAYKAAGQASNASHNYLYDCNDDRFEEAMVYYHVDTTQRKLQSLGFSGTSAILAEPIPAHAHYYADCNAFYSPVDTGLHFGDCGANVHDTAEDGDVIIHEYGHAIQDDQVPGWAFGAALVVEQARGMGEGFGDFLAAAMTGSPCIGDWVNFGQNACAGATGLRYLQNTKTFADFNSCPDNPDGSAEEHCTGEIWGAALWDLVEALGGDQDAIDLAITLVIDSHFYLGPQATFDDGVCAIFAADNDLYGGAHGATIANVFSNRGINCTFVPPPDFPYVFLRVIHPAAGNLVIRIKAGANPNSPVCNLLIWNQTAGTDVVGFVGLNGTACAGSLPPSTTTPWWLEVQDMTSGNTGTIQDFEVVLSGTIRCIADDTPLSIPDGSPGAIVRSMTDCDTASEPLPTPDNVWYFAEGYTGDGWQTYTYLLNDTSSTALVQVDYLLLGGGAVTKNITLAPQTRRSLFANDTDEGPGPNSAFGIRITSNQ
ncbi:MAG TPA: M36 family metallopeptidase, partial [Dehalococcoidia bacterium]|nr:M36 family metallopeptidase [Dehalococcoidia bacterium]